MANFLENLFEQLQKARSRTVLREIRGEQFASVSGRELLEQIARARNYLRGGSADPATAARCWATTRSNGLRWIWR